MDVGFLAARKTLLIIIADAPVQMSDVLQRSAVRNAESVFLWIEFRRFLGALERSVSRRVATSLRCAMGSQGEWKRCALRTHPWCRGILFCRMPPWVVGSYRPKTRGRLRPECPKVTISGAFHEQITHAKAGYKTNRGSSQNHASLSSLECTVSYLRRIISDLEWAS